MLLHADYVLVFSVACRCYNPVRPRAELRLHVIDLLAQILHQAGHRGRSQAVAALQKNGSTPLHALLILSMLQHEILKTVRHDTRRPLPLCMNGAYGLQCCKTQRLLSCSLPGEPHATRFVT